MTVLKNPKWMYAKAFMFVVIGLLSFGLLLLPQSLVMRVLLQLLMAWAFARAYYFAFYVIEHYIDGRYAYAGLFDFCQYLLHRSRAQASPPPLGDEHRPWR